MIIHRKLPEGAWRARYEAEFYKLKPRKKVAYENNKELRVGLRHLIWSKYAHCFYERRITDGTLPENITYYTKAKLLYLWPDEENKKEIREDVEKHKMGYWTLMQKRQLEMEHERHLVVGNKGEAYKTKDQIFRDKRYKR